MARQNPYKAKKSYGQHFLNNEAIAQRIAQSLHRAEGITNVVEIGPGKGMLTKHLLDQDINLKVIEADRDMVAYLNLNYPELKDDIIFLDFLKTNMYKVFDGEPFYMIGNYPYNISSQIVFKMLKAKELVPEMVGMFQKEMAERIIAPPGNKVYGVISVLTQAHFEGEILMKIAPGSFSPPPKVQSAVIRLKRKEQGELNYDHRLFRQVVKATFGQRRKMLRNTLKTIVNDPDFLNDPDFQERPEQLSVQDFINLTIKISKYKDEFGAESNE